MQEVRQSREIDTRANSLDESFLARPEFSEREAGMSGFGDKGLLVGTHRMVEKRAVETASRDDGLNINAYGLTVNGDGKSSLGVGEGEMNR